jgi:hypothetical protein
MWQRNRSYRTSTEGSLVVGAAHSDGLLWDRDQWRVDGVFELYEQRLIGFDYLCCCLRIIYCLFLYCLRVILTYSYKWSCSVWP